ncbi:MAG: tetratricopeptide repeat protein [Methanomassiliicoccales archaeon]|nr:tetratricopeptide repeat protein [Methanomassiliicoccales archaeon]
MLKPAAIWLVVGGILTFVASIWIFIGESVFGTTLGTLIVLLLFLIGGLEISSSKTVWRAEIGGWRGVMMAVGLSVLFRIIMVYLSKDFYLFWTGAAIGVGEFLIFLLLYAKRDLFLPSEEERAAVMGKIEASSVKTVAECPSCHAIVEPDWESCPDCGVSLPKLCASCGEPLERGVAKCPCCGAEVEKSASVMKMIKVLRASAEEDVPPETKSSRYARLAEGLLKSGEIQAALDSYEKAIENTGFARKRCHFMVKMATILKNTGRTEEAVTLLDEAIASDTEDYAGAAKLKNEILSGGKPADACNVPQAA